MKLPVFKYIFDPTLKVIVLSNDLFANSSVLCVKRGRGGSEFGLGFVMWSYALS